MPDYQWNCRICGYIVDAGHDNCTNCKNPANISAEDIEQKRAEWKMKKTTSKKTASQKTIISTTPTLEGYSIEEYFGVIVGEAVLGANIVKDFFAGVRDVVGGRSDAYENELRKARSVAFAELSDEAKQLGANAVVGVDLDYEVMGPNGSIIMVSASGTAVRIEKL